MKPKFIVAAFIEYVSLMPLRLSINSSLLHLMNQFLVQETVNLLEPVSQ
jgi:hypothetical protein